MGRLEVEGRPRENLRGETQPREQREFLQRKLPGDVGEGGAEGPEEGSGPGWAEAGQQEGQGQAWGGGWVLGSTRTLKMARNCDLKSCREVVGETVPFEFPSVGILFLRCSLRLFTLN